MKKYYHFDTMFQSLKNELAKYLKTRGIYYELSGCFGGYHFEILTDERGAQSINDFIDTITIKGEFAC